MRVCYCATQVWARVSGPAFLSGGAVEPNPRQPVTSTGHKPPWHRGPHDRLARQMNATAYANPHTICMGGCTCHARTIDQCTCHQACGRTLAQHPPTRIGKPVWTAGHRWSGTRAVTLDQYRHEIRGCNSAASNRTRGQATTRNW